MWGESLCSGLSRGYGGHLAALLNFKSPSNYTHQPDPSSSPGGWWGLISSGCGLLWLHTKPHVDIPEDRALCKHTRPHQMARRGRTGLGPRTQGRTRKDRKKQQDQKEDLPPKCQATPAIHQAVTLRDVLLSSDKQIFFCHIQYTTEQKVFFLCPPATAPSP